MNIFSLKNLRIILFLILILGICRFIYATSFKEGVSLFNQSYAEAAFDDYYVNKNIDRSWGPITVILISGIKNIVSENYTTFIWRIGQFISYTMIIYFLVKIISEFKLLLQNNNTQIWYLIIIFVSFQSAGAIYNINNGGGEIFTALCILGHFYFFYKKKYFISSIFIIVGIYFKFHPVVFAIPFFIANSQALPPLAIISIYISKVSVIPNSAKALTFAL